MELKHLRYIIAVAEEGHITRAAERLGMQQPPLSRVIKAIEREIDVQIFRRTPRGVKLTDAGRTFLDGAHAIFTTLDRTLESTRRTARGEQGRISVGFTTSAAFHPLVPRIIRDFRESFPLVSVALVESSPVALIERMENEQLDAAFVRMPHTNLRGLVIHPLAEEAMVVALPIGHRLAESKRGANAAIALKALAVETFVVYRSHGAWAWLRDAVFAACHAAGFSPRVGQEAPHVVSALPLVAAGIGLAIVPASLEQMNIRGVAYRRLNGAAKLKAPLSLALRRSGTSMIVRHFLELARRTAKDFQAD